MKAAPVLAFAVLLSACASVAPVPIRAGDTCFHCRRTIVDPALAAEVISQEGRAFKFSSVACMTEYLKEHANEPVKATFVTDYARGKMLTADKAWFVEFEVDPRLKARDFAAFGSSSAATEFGAKHQATPVGWDQVRVADVAHTH